MVCDRCVLMVENLLNEMEVKPLTVSLGVVEYGETVLNKAQVQQLRDKIEPVGFELIEDKKKQLIEGIKKSLIGLISQEDALLENKLSTFLSDELHHDYGYLSNLFSSVEGVTIEQFFIQHKIEKVKELLMYDEMSVTQISYSLGYSSPAHLSGQFKKITGLTPSYFKSLRDERQRKSLDKV